MSYLTMGSLTLTKASRLQERIRVAVRGLPLATHVTLGIFASEPGHAPCSSSSSC